MKKQHAAFIDKMIGCGMDAALVYALADPWSNRLSVRAVLVLYRNDLWTKDQVCAANLLAITFLGHKSVAFIKQRLGV